MIETGELPLFVHWEDDDPDISLNPKSILSFEHPFDKQTTSSFSIQGSKMIERGGKRYLIQAAERDVPQSAVNTDPDGGEEYYSALCIYEYPSGKLMNSAYNIPFGHGNDLEFNENTDKILICSSIDDSETMTEVNWDLSEYKRFTPAGTEGLRIADCSYDGSSGRYFVAVTPIDSNYCKEAIAAFVYDESWNIIQTIPNPFDQLENHYGFQGSCISDGVFYLINFLKDNTQRDKTNSFEYCRISMFELDTMRYAGSVSLNIHDEIEDITILDSVAYLNGQRYGNDDVSSNTIYEYAVRRVSSKP